MRNFVALCALFSASLSAMEQPQNNNNNTVPQATTKHVPTLKELCCRKLAQGVAAECEKYGDKAFTSGTKICKDLRLDYVANCLDDLIKAAATIPDGEVVAHCYVDYPCSEIFSANLLLAKVGLTEWELYNQKLRKTTHSIDEAPSSPRLAVSPDEKYLAINKGRGSVEIYEIDHIMVHNWNAKYKKGVRGDPLLKSNFENPDLEFQFHGTKTLLVLTHKMLYALDILSKSQSLVYDFTEEAACMPKFKPCSENTALFLYDIKSTNGQRLSVLTYSSKEWGFKEIASRKYYDGPMQILACHKTGSALIDCMHHEIRFYRDVIQAKKEYTTLDCGKVDLATFCPDGECVAVLYIHHKYILSANNTPMHGCESQISVYSLVGNKPTFLWQYSDTTRRTFTMLWPSYETGIIKPDGLDGKLKRYNTIPAQILARYKKSIEQSNNNTHHTCVIS